MSAFLCLLMAFSINLNNDDNVNKALYCIDTITITYGFTCLINSIGCRILTVPDVMAAACLTTDIVMSAPSIPIMEILQLLSLAKLPILKQIQWEHYQIKTAYTDCGRHQRFEDPVSHRWLHPKCRVHDSTSHPCNDPAIPSIII